MPVGAEPRVEVEAHRGPPPVRGPERLRANPAQLFQALERALHDPGLRQPGPLLAVHLARGERACQPAVGGPFTGLSPTRTSLSQKRAFTVSGEELKYHVPAASAGGTADVVWKRVK